MDYTSFLKKYANHPNYFSPTGNKLNAKSWQTEAPLRMLLNNLNADVAEDPSNLIVYGGSGQAARNVESVEKIIKMLLDLENDESLLVQNRSDQSINRSWVVFPFSPINPKRKVRVESFRPLYYFLRNETLALPFRIVRPCLVG